MAGISIGESVGEGFGLITRRPVTVLAWGLARTVIVASMVSAMAPFYLELLNQMANRAAAGVTTPPDLTQMTSLMSMEGAVWLMSLLAQFLGAVLYCAALRAVLFPDQKSYAYLRLGSAEIFLFLLIFGGSFALGIGMVVIAIPIAVIVGIAIGLHAIAAGVAIGVAGVLAVLALMIWIICRLATVAPMMVEDGKFHLADAWALTRGHFWSLFAIGLLLMVILMILEVIVGAVGLVVGIGYLSQAAGGPEGLKTFFTRPPGEILSTLAPALVVAGLVSIPWSGAANAIVMAPWARVYRDLRPSTDVAATFA